MKYKKPFIAILIFIIFFIFGIYALTQNTDNSFVKSIKDKTPTYVKDFLKETIFYVPYTKRELKRISKQYEEVYKENKLLILERDKLDNILNTGKSTIEYFDYDKYKFYSSILPFNDDKNLFANKKSGYLGIYKKHILSFFTSGKIVFIDKINFYKGSLDYFIVDNNLKDKKLFDPKVNFAGIKDIFVDNETLYISLTEEIKKNCFNTSLYKAKINFKFINFEEVYRTNECFLTVNKANSFRYFSGYQTGGRIEKIKDKIYLSLGDYNKWENVQTLKSSAGKVLEIDVDSNKFKFVSIGHRNPQGLHYIENSNLLISTEHGPKGGDEINLINLDEKDSTPNYGWPIASYGKHYPVFPINSFTKKYAPLKKSHKENGFIEPLKYFTPAIGISQIIENYTVKNNFFVSSLRQKTIFEVQLDSNFNFIKTEKEIKIGERIRDIIYDNEHNCYLIYGESTPKLISMCPN